jgi:hypothetical protein
MFSTKPESLPELVTQESIQYVVPSIDIPPSLLEECEPLLILDTTANFEQILADRADTVSKYKLCREKHRSLKLLIIKALDLNESR